MLNFLSRKKTIGLCLMDNELRLAVAQKSQIYFVERCRLPQEVAFNNKIYNEGLFAHLVSEFIANLGLTHSYVNLVFPFQLLTIGNLLLPKGTHSGVIAAEVRLAVSQHSSTADNYCFDYVVEEHPDSADLHAHYIAMRQSYRDSWLLACRRSKLRIAFASAGILYLHTLMPQLKQQKLLQSDAVEHYAEFQRDVRLHTSFNQQEELMSYIFPMAAALREVPKWMK